MKTLKFATGSRQQIQIGRFVCNRYEGQFQSPALQAKAETGMWYCYAQGTGLGIEGEGRTPEYAIRDTKKRATQMREELTRVYDLNPTL